MKFPDHNLLMRFITKAWFLPALLSCSVGEREEYYTADDFSRVPKIDAHFHYNTTDTRYLEFADSIKMWFVSPNVDAGRSIIEQFEIARTIKESYPDRFFFLGTFPVDNFSEPGFSGEVIRQIREAMASGASGIKVWKNIGMELKNRDGEYVMIDDPAFHPVFEYLQENSIPLLGHLGEPLNCWLPVEEMTLGNDKRYFANNPQYHMYLHPEAPSYRDQINARDNVLKRHPQLVFSGAHLASLEWSIDELAGHFDAFPSAYVDISARIGHLQFQSLSDHQKVRDFLIKYQDRIMYGTDMSVSERSTDYRSTTSGLHRRWLDDWVYLATGSTISVNDLDGQEVKGLRLPASVIDRIYYRNAEQFFITVNGLN
jgi:predicted TIM-barrel fold metal-dependent hydrolase